MKIKSKILKIVLTSLLVLSFSACDDKKDDITKISSEKKVKLPKPEWEDRLTNYKDTGVWYQQADDDEIAAYNIANTYSEKIKDNKKAIEWYLYSDSIKTNNKNLVNMGITFQDIKDYDNAIKYYKKAYIYNDKEAANGLGLVYKNYLKDYKNAEIWFKKAIERESLDAIKNLGLLYHNNLKDDVKACAYYIALIDEMYSKELVLRLFKERWKLSNETIKEGYELQLKMEGLPRRYTGDLNLD